MYRLVTSLALLGISCSLYGQAPTPTPAPSTSATLPGKGLAQHDFLYAGESKSRRIFLVRHGEIAWTYNDPDGKGEISDAVMLSNGNILFAHQFGVTLINPEKKVIWNYDAPDGQEVHTAMPIGKDRVLFVQNGDPALVRVVNIVTGATEKEFNIPTKMPPSTHGQIRHARLTADGTLMIAHMDLNKVAGVRLQRQRTLVIPRHGALGSNSTGQWKCFDHGPHRCARSHPPRRFCVDVQPLGHTSLPVRQPAAGLETAERQYGGEQLGE